MYRLSNSLFAGMSKALLLANLAKAQQAYIDLSTGGKGETYSYTQGDGAKAVTYTRANLAALAALIRELQSVTDTIGRPRRPIRFLMR